MLLGRSLPNEHRSDVALTCPHGHRPRCPKGPRPDARPDEFRAPPICQYKGARS